MIIVGISGGEAGIRGFIDAYDAETGKLRVALLDHSRRRASPAHDTWTRDELEARRRRHLAHRLLRSRARPPLLGHRQPGTGLERRRAAGRQPLHLRRCSRSSPDREAALALPVHAARRPRLGRQPDPGAARRRPIGGRARKLLATANRNAFYYLLDRETGEFLHASPYAKQTWADGIDAKGRPIVRPNTEPTRRGTLVWPSLQGATNWFSPSYSPQTKLFYVPVREMGAYYYKGEAEYEAGLLLHRRRRARAERRSGLGRDPRARRHDRRAEVGVEAAHAAVVGRDGDRAAASSSAARRKDTSSRSTRRPARRCGASRPARRCAPTRCRSPSRAASTSRWRGQRAVRVRVAVGGSDDGRQVAALILSSRFPSSVRAVRGSCSRHGGPGRGRGRRWDPWISTWRWR